MRTSRSARTLVSVVMAIGLVGGGVASAGLSRYRMSSSDRTTGAADQRRTPDALSRAFENGRLDRAEYALERASSLFALGEVRDRFGDVEKPDPHAATGLLRDLALHKDELSGTDRRRANSILARPTDEDADPHGDGYQPGTNPTKTCHSMLGGPPFDVCYTWVTTTSDQISSTDTSPANGFPDYVDAASNVMLDVWQKEVVDLGYKKPQGDGNSPNQAGNPEFDIYFADIGDDGLYGYCTTDEPGAADKQTVSAYCVLDNDYDPAQYNAPPPEVSGMNAFKVTLAHEFFHAIQFNYDWREALFLMEGTAVWMEDEVYDGINASYAFLFDSALHQPEIPLDAFQGDDDENFEYGAFVFFTYMSEAHQKPNYTGANIVKFIWKAAEKAGTRGFAAIAAALKNHSKQAPCSNCGYPGPSTPFRDFFAEWGAANAVYDAYYSEGFVGPGCPAGLDDYADVLRCQRPPFDGQYLVAPSRPSTGWRSLPMDRRSNRFVELFPSSAPPNPPITQLRVTVNLPNRARGGEASLLMFTTGDFHRIKLNDKGNGSKKIPFGGTESTGVLILSNTGSHNNETYKFKAEAL